MKSNNLVLKREQEAAVLKREAQQQRTPIKPYRVGSDRLDYNVCQSEA